MVQNQKIDKEVYQYVNRLLKNLYIEVSGFYKGNIMNLMKKGNLQGWCFQTTESCILFFPNDASINRGTLILEKKNPYQHSWIDFSYEDNQYVFDPCLNILCKKELYDNVFEVDITSSVSAQVIKQEFIMRMTNPIISEKQRLEEAKRKLLQNTTVWTDVKTKEVKINGSDDIQAPFYRNDVGYQTTIEDGHVKSLSAHYYFK